MLKKLLMIILFSFVFTQEQSITNITVSQRVDGSGTVDILYDLRGRLVETIYSGYIKHGFHKYKWNASRYASGIYFIHMIAGENVLTKKITLLK